MSQHPIWHETLRTGLPIPSGFGSKSLACYLLGKVGQKMVSLQKNIVCEYQQN
jgi:hypothetical protein